VLLTAVGSLHSADCDTEWQISINVMTGFFVLQTTVGILQSGDCDTK